MPPAETEELSEATHLPIGPAATSERDRFSTQKPPFVALAEFRRRQHGHIILTNVGLAVDKYILIW